MPGKLEMVSEKVARLPVYAVAEIARVKRRLISRGVDVIDLGVGDPDFSPPQIAVDALVEALRDPAMSRYGFQQGLPAFRESVSAYMKRRFGIDMDPVEEVLPLIGSKEGLAHLALGILNPGDVCVIPDPGYPAYIGGGTFAGADLELYPLREDQDFLLELETIGAARLAKTRLVYLNYPNNPTGAIAPRDYLKRIIDLCSRYGIILAYDNPYCELTYDGYVAPSIFEIEGAREVAVEFHSFSKSFGMTGWRLAWACGSMDLLEPLWRTKTYIDAGPFLALQQAGSAVIDAAEECMAPVKMAFAERRTTLLDAFASHGFTSPEPRGAMYLWVPIPENTRSADLASSLLENEGVAVLAGSALGDGGEGFMRLSFACGPDRLREGVGRIVAGFNRLGIGFAHA